jgi:hypothetical protein
MNKKRQKYNRIRNIKADTTYSAEEIIHMLSSFDEYTPVIVKWGNTNFRICSDLEIDNKPVLIIQKY